MDMNMRLSPELLNRTTKEEGARLRMLADFKKMKAGRVYTVKDAELADWLRSRQYAEWA